MRVWVHSPVLEIFRVASLKQAALLSIAIKAAFGVQLARYALATATS